MGKVRADQLCVSLGIAESRTSAQRLIADGQIVLEDGTAVRKASQALDDSVSLRALSQLPYVSRGAYKLLGALDAFPHDLAGVTALDIGASTGGFTDVLLQHGARCVYAVDVGTDQLHPRLRADSRVISLEQTNARDLSRELIPDEIDVLVADVSFISLTKVLPHCAPLLGASAWIAVLVKPQFEAEPSDIGKNGVIRDEGIRQRCVQKIVEFCVKDLKWRSLGVCPSPILGQQGNQEYLAVFEK